MQPATHLLIIDPQNDFCDLPQERRPAGSAPALPVPGADADMQRLAGLIRSHGAALEQISITLDSHQRMDIAHPTFWVDGAGLEVAPFTEITADQVRAGAFRPLDPALLTRALAYLDALEARGCYRLMVWPVHCEIGTWGHAVHADVAAACRAWEIRSGRRVTLVRKGENPWTEHYSAILAEVPDPEDARTQLNLALLDDLGRAGHILVAGEASSHCVRATTEHLVEHLPGGHPERIRLLVDCMSPVAGFQARHDDFMAQMQAHGVGRVHLAELRDTLPS